MRLPLYKNLHRFGRLHWGNSRHIRKTYLCGSGSIEGVDRALSLDGSVRWGNCIASGNCSMPLRFGFYHCCEIIGRTSAVIMLIGMGSIVLAATAADIVR